MPCSAMPTIWSSRWRNTTPVLRPVLFGSTDMHLLRKCPCPVWIDRLGGATGYRRMLAAVDPFDDESGDLQRLILDLATSLAEREHATLDVVHAWELPGESMLANGRGRIPRTELDLLLEANRKTPSARPWIACSRPMA